MKRTSLNFKDIGKRFKIYHTHDEDDIEDGDLPMEDEYDGTGVLSDIGSFMMNGSYYNDMTGDRNNGYTFTRYTDNDVFVEGDNYDENDEDNMYNIDFNDEMILNMWIWDLKKR
jgi:hypothetical protein